MTRNFDDIITLLKNFRRWVAGMIYQAGATKHVVRRKPNRMHGIANTKPLSQIEQQKPHRLVVDDSELPGIFGDNMGIGNPAIPEVAKRRNRVRKFDLRPINKVSGAGIVIRRRNPKESWLHRTGWDFEGLEKKRADAHGYGNRHQKHLDVLAQARVWIWFQPFVRRGFEVRHFGIEDGAFGVAANGVAQIADCLLHILDRVSGKQITLRVENFLHMLVHVRCRAHPA
jgi:hypothetical protein